MTDYQKIIDKYYLPGTRVREILLKHSRQVADKALAIAHSLHLELSDDAIEAAAMLHDIGIYLTDAAGIGCHGTEPYIRHGILGAALLRNEGTDEEIAAVAERHTGAGITADDIKQMSLPIPEGDYMPRTLLERLICYADKFYSKSGDMKEKPLEKVRASMLRHSQPTLERFEALHNEFGNADQ
jgi:uncharacterized protein